jgi:[acyl-carrier-protein] S-malonyltransferase
MTGYREPGMLALLFPGQGSQRPGMGQAWRATPAWGLVDEVSEATGSDAGHLLNDAGVEELKATRNSQMATFTLSLVILDAVRSAVAGMDDHVTAMAGHSLGEYTALVASGAVNRLDGARLVKARGEAMQAAADADPGTMAAVLGLDAETVAKACAGAEGAWVANDNAPGQVVIAGTTAGVETASSKAKELGAKRVLPLPVGGAFHSPLMAPAQGRLDAALGVVSFAAPAVPVVANVDAREHTDGASWPQLLSQQLCQQVRWRESLVALDGMGVTIFVELGAGTELCGMVKRTLDGATRASVATPEDLPRLSEHLDAAR